MTEPRELKNCPYCGNKAEILDGAVYPIGCRTPNCHGFIYRTNYSSNKESAIKEWNTRSRPEGVVPTVEELANIIATHIPPAAFMATSPNVFNQAAQAIHARLGSLVPLEEKEVAKLLNDTFGYYGQPQINANGEQIAKLICAKFGAKQVRDV